jgi:hypothetical protein
LNKAFILIIFFIFSSSINAITIEAGLSSGFLNVNNKTIVGSSFPIINVGFYKNNNVKLVTSLNTLGGYNLGIIPQFKILQLAFADTSNFSSTTNIIKDSPNLSVFSAGFIGANYYLPKVFNLSGRFFVGLGVGYGYQLVARKSLKPAVDMVNILEDLKSSNADILALSKNPSVKQAFLNILPYLDEIANLTGAYYPELKDSVIVGLNEDDINTDFYNLLFRANLQLKNSVQQKADGYSLACSNILYCKTGLAYNFVFGYNMPINESWSVNYFSQVQGLFQKIDNTLKPTTSFGVSVVYNF